MFVIVEFVVTRTEQMHMYTSYNTGIGLVELVCLGHVRRSRS